MAESSAEQKTFTQKMRCPLCGKFLWYSHDYLNGRRVDGIRFRPLDDPAAMSQCPKCDGLWYAYEPDLKFEVVEGERVPEVAAEQTMTLDNLHGRSTLRRQKEVSEEWSTQLEISVENTSTDHKGAQIGVKDLASYSVVAENALKVSYRTVDQHRRTYTESFEFEVPVGVLRVVTFTFKRIWQHGVLRAEGRGGETVEIPYRVVNGYELDVRQTDSTA